MLFLKIGCRITLIFWGVGGDESVSILGEAHKQDGFNNALINVW